MSKRGRPQKDVPIPELPPCCTRPGFTYVIASAESDGGRVKIGCCRTGSVRDRLMDLQCGSPVLLKVIGLSRGHDLERVMHDRLDHLREHGEWFGPEAWTGIRWLFARHDMCAACAVNLCGPGVVVAHRPRIIRRRGVTYVNGAPSEPVRAVSAFMWRGKLRHA